MRFVVSEKFRRAWHDFAVVPASSPDQAIDTARRIGMRPKDRPMKAAVRKVTKK